MSSFIPHNNQSIVAPGQDVITPEDGFYPVLSLNRFREVMRVDDSVSNERIIMQIKAAIMVICRDVGKWRNHQTAQDLSDIIGMDRPNAWEMAVFNRAKAYIIENYRDIDTTNDGHAKADAMESRIATYLQHSREFQRVMTARPRSSIFLV